MMYVVVSSLSNFINPAFLYNYTYVIGETFGILLLNKDTIIWTSYTLLIPKQDMYKNYNKVTNIWVEM